MGRNPSTVSYDPLKFGGHRHSGSGVIAFNSLVISKSRVIKGSCDCMQHLTEIMRPIPPPPPPAPTPPQLSMLFASIWDSFLAQASVLLLFQYAATLCRQKRPDLFVQSGSFQNLHKFFQELTLCLKSVVIWFSGNF